MPIASDSATVIDVSEIRTSKELHELISLHLGFPDYYGLNWDAFDECIREVEVPRVVEIRGFSTLRFVLPRDAALLKDCFASACANVQGLKVRFHVG